MGTPIFSKKRLRAHGQWGSTSGSGSGPTRSSRSGWSKAADENSKQSADDEVSRRDQQRVLLSWAADESAEGIDDYRESPGQAGDRDFRTLQPGRTERSLGRGRGGGTGSNVDGAKRPIVIGPRF